jgi:hypothetical protein
MRDEPATRAFWAEMSACEHFVQIYEADHAFMDTLTGFVAGGLRQEEGAVVIATAAHREELHARLEEDGFDVAAAIRDDRLLLLDADHTIDRFLANGWPDEDKFSCVVREILARAGGNGRRVRAFGEMVAILWARGFCAATVRLEHLWQQFCQQQSFTLFCAYPKSGFTEHPSESMARVCAEHSKVFPI